MPGSRRTRRRSMTTSSTCWSVSVGTGTQRACSLTASGTRCAPTGRSTPRAPRATSAGSSVTGRVRQTTRVGRRGDRSSRCGHVPTPLRAAPRARRGRRRFGREHVRPARLLLLASEIALADGAGDWLSAAAPTLSELADRVAAVDVAVAVRLRLVEADVTGEWSALLRDARTRAIRGRSRR